MLQHFALFADYNHWMNENIYQSAAQLSTKDYKKDLGAFFGSVSGTLNHILVGDTIWMNRFSKLSNFPVKDSELPSLIVPNSLDQILYPEFPDLKQARFALDELIIKMIAGLDETLLQTTLEYRNTRGVASAKSFGMLLLHFFNHQTHHRGQVTTLLSQLKVKVGVTDLLVRIPSE